MDKDAKEWNDHYCHQPIGADQITHYCTKRRSPSKGVGHHQKMIHEPGLSGQNNSSQKAQP
jgi:hypothetical protein